MYNTPWHCTDVTHTNGHKLKFCRTQITTSCCVLYQLDSPERTIQFVVDFPLRLQDVSHISDNNSLPFCVKWLTRPQIILVRIFIHVYICIYVWSYIVFVLGLLCCIYRAYLCCIFVCNKAITFDGVMSHMNESCHIRKSHVSLPLLRICMQQGKHIWLSHVPYEWVMSRTKQSCQLTFAAYLYANSGNHIRLSHVPYEWVMSHTKKSRQLTSAAYLYATRQTHWIESCPIWMGDVTYETVMSAYLCYVSVCKLRQSHLIESCHICVSE